MEGWWYMKPEDQKEWYKTWFAYLIHCPEYLEYINRTFHKHQPLDSLPETVRHTGDLYYEWTYAITGELWERYPGMDDFAKVWGRLTRFRSGKLYFAEKFIDDPLGNHIYSAKRALPEILEEYKNDKITIEAAQQEIEQAIRNTQISGRLAAIPDPLSVPKNETLNRIERELEPCPDLLATPLGQSSYGDTPLTPEEIFAQRGRASKINILKRYLTWYCLKAEGVSLYHYYDGEFTDEETVFGQINFTGEHYETLVNERVKSRQASDSPPSFGDGGPEQPLEALDRVVRHKRSAIAKKRDRELSDFRRWVQAQAAEAKKVLRAVALGHFPYDLKDAKLQK